MLRVIVCKVLKLEYLDYNAQPKLFYNDIDHSKMESLRGFSIDIAICSANRSRNTKPLDSLEANRENGMSSWNLGAVSLVKLAISYLIEIKKIKSLRF